MTINFDPAEVTRVSRAAHAAGEGAVDAVVALVKMREAMAAAEAAAGPRPDLATAGGSVAAERRAVEAAHRLREQAVCSYPGHAGRAAHAPCFDDAEPSWAEQIEAAREAGYQILPDRGYGEAYFVRTDEFGNPLDDQTPVSVRLRELNEKRKAEAESA